MFQRKVRVNVPHLILTSTDFVYFVMLSSVKWPTHVYFVKGSSSSSVLFTSSPGSEVAQTYKHQQRVSVCHFLLSFGRIMSSHIHFLSHKSHSVFVHVLTSAGVSKTEIKVVTFHRQHWVYFCR